MVELETTMTDSANRDADITKARCRSWSPDAGCRKSNRPGARPDLTSPCVAAASPRVDGAGAALRSSDVGAGARAARLLRVADRRELRARRRNPVDRRGAVRSHGAVHRRARG